MAIGLYDWGIAFDRAGKRNWLIRRGDLTPPPPFPERKGGGNPALSFSPPPLREGGANPGAVFRPLSLRGRGAGGVRSRGRGAGGVRSGRPKQLHARRIPRRRPPRHRVRPRRRLLPGQHRPAAPRARAATAPGVV